LNNIFSLKFIKLGGQYKMQTKYKILATPTEIEATQLRSTVQVLELQIEDINQQIVVRTEGIKENKVLNSDRLQRITELRLKIDAERQTKQPEIPASEKFKIIRLDAMIARLARNRDRLEAAYKIEIEPVLEQVANLQARLIAIDSEIVHFGSEARDQSGVIDGLLIDATSRYEQTDKILRDAQQNLERIQRNSPTAQIEHFEASKTAILSQAGVRDALQEDAEIQARISPLLKTLREYQAQTVESEAQIVKARQEIKELREHKSELDRTSLREARYKLQKTEKAELTESCERLIPGYKETCDQLIGKIESYRGSRKLAINSELREYREQLLTSFGVGSDSGISSAMSQLTMLQDKIDNIILLEHSLQEILSTKLHSSEDFMRSFAMLFSLPVFKQGSVSTDMLTRLDQHFIGCLLKNGYSLATIQTKLEMPNAIFERELRDIVAIRTNLNLRINALTELATSFKDALEIISNFASTLGACPVLKQLSEADILHSFTEKYIQTITMLIPILQDRTNNSLVEDIHGVQEELAELSQIVNASFNGLFE
jgi:hypothetical protein